MERGRAREKSPSIGHKVKEKWKSFRRRLRSRGSNGSRPPSPQPRSLINVSSQASSQSVPLNSGTDRAIPHPGLLPTPASPPLETGNAVQDGNSAARACVPSVVISPPSGETRVSEQEPESGRGAAVAEEDTPAGDEAADQAVSEEPDVYEPLSVKAYAELHEEEQELVANYRKAVLKLQQKGNDDRSDASEPAGEVQQLEQIQSRAQKMIDQIPDTYLTVTVNIGGERKLVIREGVQKVVKLLLKYKDVIKEGMTAAPQGALIWAGVTVVLPMLQDMFQQDEDAVDGFGLLTTMTVRLSLIETTFLAPKNTAKDTDQHRLCTILKKHAVAVYKLVYQYQMEIVSHYTRNKFRRKLDDLTKSDWNDRTKKVEKECSQVEKIIQDLAHADDLARYNSVTGDLANIGSDIKKLQDVMKIGFDKAEDGRIRDTLNSLDTASTALFDSDDNNDRRECLQGTQKAMLSQIQDWLDDKDAELVFLLRGMAGTGKSSIAKTVAIALDRACRIGAPSSAAAPGAPGSAFLAGSFFFRRDNDNRNSPQRLFTTIATSLADRVPALRTSIAEAIQNNPHISTKLPQVQSDLLILEPLSRIDQSLPFAIYPVVVIDALDECAGFAAAHLVTLLADLNNLSKARLRFIVTSRPDAVLEPRTNTTLCRTVELTKIPQVSGTHQLQDSDDITQLLDHDIREITTEYYKGNPWLQEDDIQRLVQRADGLFIYAATISRFLGGKMAPNTRRSRLGMIFNQESVNNQFSPDAALNRIYSSVLGFPHLDLTEEEKIENFRPALQILGCISAVLEPVSVETMCKFLDIAEDALRDSLSDIHAIVHVPLPGRNDASSNQNLGFFHLSFREFLLSKERAGKFWVDDGLVHQTLVESCFTIMEEELRQDICNLHNPGILKSEIPPQRVSRYIRPHLRYACLYWVRHLARLTTDARARVGLQQNGRIHDFLRSRFLFWLEAMSLLGSVSQLIRLVKVLESLCQESNELSAFIYDAWRFTLQHQKVADEAPLQIYISALIFSPTESIIRRTFTGLIPKWITRVPKLKKHWDRRLYSITEEKRISSMMLSSDGTLLIVQRGGKLLAFDTITGELRFEVSADRSCDVTLEGPWLRYTNNSVRWRMKIYGAGLGTVEEDHSPETSPIRAARTSAVEGLFKYDDVKLPEGSYLVEIHTFEKAAVAVFDGEVEANGRKVSNKCVVAWSPDGKVLWKRTIKFLQLTYFVRLKSAVSEDVILIQNGDRTISAWSTVCGTLLWKCLCPNAIFAWAATKSNTRVAVASDNKIRIFDIYSLSAPAYFINWEQSPIKCCCFSTTPDMLFFGTWDGKITAIDTVLTPFTPASLETDSPHGSQLSVAGDTQESHRQIDGMDVRYVALEFRLGLVTVTKPNATSSVNHYSVQLWDPTLTRIVFQCDQVVAISTSVHLRTIVLVTLSSVLELDVDTLTTRTLLSPTPKKCTLYRLTPDASVSVWRKGQSLYAIGMESRNELYTAGGMSLDASFFVERSLSLILKYEFVWLIVDTATGSLLWKVKGCRGSRHMTELTSQKLILAYRRRDQGFQLQIFDIKSKTVVRCLSFTPGTHIERIYATWSDLIILDGKFGGGKERSKATVVLGEDLYSVRCAFRRDYDQSPRYAQRESVSMEEDDSLVIFGRGRLLCALDRDHRPSQPLSKLAQKCLHASGSWIYQDHRRLIWIGPENVAPAVYLKGSTAIWVSGGSVMCTLDSGNMLVLEVDLERTPFARGWDIADGDVSDDCEQVQTESFMIGLDHRDIWAQHDDNPTLDANESAGTDDSQLGMNAADDDSSAGDDDIYSWIEADEMVISHGSFGTDFFGGEDFGEVESSEEDVHGRPGESTKDKPVWSATSSETTDHGDAVDDSDDDSDDGFDYGDFVGAECFFEKELRSSRLDYL